VLNVVQEEPKGLGLQPDDPDFRQNPKRQNLNQNAVIRAIWWANAAQSMAQALKRQAIWGTTPDYRPGRRP